MFRKLLYIDEQCKREPRSRPSQKRWWLARPRVEPRGLVARSRNMDRSGTCRSSDRSSAKSMNTNIGERLARSAPTEKNNTIFIIFLRTWRLSFIWLILPKKLVMQHVPGRWWIWDIFLSETHCLVCWELLLAQFWVSWWTVSPLRHSTSTWKVFSFEDCWMSLNHLC